MISAYPIGPPETSTGCRALPSDLSPISLAGSAAKEQDPEKLMKLVAEPHARVIGVTSLSASSNQSRRAIRRRELLTSKPPWRPL
jgi:hypothetical protein